MSDELLEMAKLLERMAKRLRRMEQRIEELEQRPPQRIPMPYPWPDYGWYRFGDPPPRPQRYWWDSPTVGEQRPLPTRAESYCINGGGAGQLARSTFDFHPWGWP